MPDTVKPFSSDSAKSEAIDPILEIRRTIELARYLRLIAAVLAAALTMGFGWLKFRGVDVVGVLQPVPADFILKLAMAVYFASWVSGAVSDVSDLEFVLIKAPSPMHVKVGGTILAVLTALAFAALCLAETAPAFSTALSTLLGVNIVGWFYITMVVVPVAHSASADHYRQRGDLLRLEQLNLVCKWYLSGLWQLARLLFGLLVAIAMLALTYNWSYLQSIQPSLSAHGEILAAGLFLAYVLGFEGWIWFMRMRVKGGLRLLQNIEQSYELCKRGV